MRNQAQPENSWIILPVCRGAVLFGSTTKLVYNGAASVGRRNRRAEQATLLLQTTLLLEWNYAGPILVQGCLILVYAGSM